MKKTKLEKGITLIALIITIVVLLILAVVTIGSIRDSKIIGHAQNAATDYKKAQEEEQIMLGYSEYKISSLKNSNAPLEIEGAKSVNGNKTNGWIVEFESGNTYKLEPNGNIDIYEPVVNEDPNGWDIAYIHDGTSWVDTHVTSPEQIEGAKIVAKFYKQTLDTPIQPGDLPLNPSAPTSFPESNEVYTLYIEGTGDMGTLVSFNESGTPTGAYGYQSGVGALLGVQTTESFLMPYVIEIVICDGITNIGVGAFAAATSLEKLTISSTVQEISNHAFLCTYLNDLVIPGSVTRIGNSAFEGSQIKNLVIEEGLSEICKRAFAYCQNMEKVSLPNSLNTIKEEAFIRCSNLISVIIPKNVITIEGHAFEYCGLENVYIESIKPDFSVGAEAFYHNPDSLTIYVRKPEIASKLGTHDGTVSTVYNWTAPTI